MDAQAILDALQAAGLPITGVNITDPTDASTWRFDGAKVTDGQRAIAISLVTTLLLPTVVEPLPPPPFTKFQFLRMLTVAEYTAFIAAAEADPVLRFAKALFDVALEVRADDPTFQQMLAYSVSLGLFSKERAAALVSAMAP